MTDHDDPRAQDWPAPTTAPVEGPPTRAVPAPPPGPLPSPPPVPPAPFGQPPAPPRSPQPTGPVGFGPPPVAHSAPAALPGYGAPGYGAPGYGAPGYGAPGYGAPGYGAPGYGVPGYGQAYRYEPPRKTNGLAVAALVLGIVPCVPLLAVILGLIARRQIRKSSATRSGKGMATAGIVLGLVWIAVFAWLNYGDSTWSRFATGGDIPNDRAIVTPPPSVVSPGSPGDGSVPSREEFVFIVANPELVDSVVGIDELPPHMVEPARAIMREAIGCLYDVLLQEPRYLNEVFREPFPDSGMHWVVGVDDERLATIDAQADAMCFGPMDQQFTEMLGG